MKLHFQNIEKFLASLFLIWLFLLTARQFGFSFGIEISVFFNFFLLFFLIFICLEAIYNKRIVKPFLKRGFTLVKELFLIKVVDINNKIFSLSPRIIKTRRKSLFFVITYSFGFFLYLLSLLKKILFSAKTFFLFVILAILGDIFIFDTTLSLVTPVLIVLWISVIRIYNFKGLISIIGALVLLILCPFSLGSKDGIVAGKAALWSYTFLGLGIIQMIWENRKIVEE